MTCAGTDILLETLSRLVRNTSMLDRFARHLKHSLRLIARSAVFTPRGVGRSVGGSEGGVSA